jgi:hypothetical protein
MSNVGHFFFAIPVPTYETLYRRIFGQKVESIKVSLGPRYVF